MKVVLSCRSAETVNWSMKSRSWINNLCLLKVATGILAVWQTNCISTSHTKNTAFFLPNLCCPNSSLQICPRTTRIYVCTYLCIYTMFKNCWAPHVIFMCFWHFVKWSDIHQSVLQVASTLLLVPRANIALWNAWTTSQWCRGLTVRVCACVCTAHLLLYLQSSLL